MLFRSKARRIELIMTLISIGLWFAYEVPGTANNGQTLGKRLLGIKVARLDGGPITARHALLRSAVAIGLWLVFAGSTMFALATWSQGDWSSLNRTEQLRRIAERNPSTVSTTSGSRSGR